MLVVLWPSNSRKILLFSCCKRHKHHNIIEMGGYLGLGPRCFQYQINRRRQFIANHPTHHRAICPKVHFKPSTILWQGRKPGDSSMIMMATRPTNNIILLIEFSRQEEACCSRPQSIQRGDEGVQEGGAALAWWGKRNTIDFHDIKLKNCGRFNRGPLVSWIANGRNIFNKSYETIVWPPGSRSCPCRPCGIPPDFDDNCSTAHGSSINIWRGQY